MDREEMADMKDGTEKCSIPVVGDYIKLDGKPYCIEKLFLEDYYTKVRACVRDSIAKLTGKEDVYLGYIYKGSDGKYERYFIVGGLENVALFICSGEENKLLCNDSDFPLLCSMGEYLDLIKSDEDVKNELLYYLKKYQRKKERPTFMEL